MWGILTFGAVSMPHHAHASSGVPQSMSLPSVLAEGDIRLYQRIFELQEDGNWTSADKLIKRLDNDVLLGHVLYQRYMHPTKYRSKYKELKAWMAKYADHPSAGVIYKLAKRRRPSNWKRPAPPQRMKSSGIAQVRPSYKRIHIPSRKLSTAERRKARSLRYRETSA